MFICFLCVCNLSDHSTNEKTKIEKSSDSVLRDSHDPESKLKNVYSVAVGCYT